MTFYMTHTVSFPHDKLWKTSLSDVRIAIDYFRQYLPISIFQNLELASLSLCSTTYVDNALRVTQSDVLYKARIAQQDSYLYLLSDQQTEPDRMMPWRLLDYNMGIWRNHLKENRSQELPLIVNIVFYNGQKPYCHPLDIRALFAAPEEFVNLVWNQPFILLDLNKITDEEMRTQEWFGVLAYFYKHTRYQDALARLKKVMPQLQVLAAKEGGDFIEALLYYTALSS